jgi:hypothetical protein
MFHEYLTLQVLSIAKTDKYEDFVENLVECLNEFYEEVDIRPYLNKRDFPDTNIKILLDNIDEKYFEELPEFKANLEFDNVDNGHILFEIAKVLPNNVDDYYPFHTFLEGMIKVDGVYELILGA